MDFDSNDLVLALVVVVVFVLVRILSSSLIFEFAKVWPSFIDDVSGLFDTARL